MKGKKVELLTNKGIGYPLLSLQLPISINRSVNYLQKGNFRGFREIKVIFQRIFCKILKFDDYLSSNYKFLLVNSFEFKFFYNMMFFTVLIYLFVLDNTFIRRQKSVVLRERVKNGRKI